MIVGRGRKFTIAIQPDDPGSQTGSSSARWIPQLIADGHTVVEVDVECADVIDQVRGADGFMWRFVHLPDSRSIAARLLPTLEDYLGIAVYPNRATAWHYDDKIAQYYLLRSLELPVPRTWIWFDRGKAEQFARRATYPMVLKLASGAGSENVRLVSSVSDALAFIDISFDGGVISVDDRHCDGISGVRRRARRAAKYLIRNRMPLPYGPFYELHKNYVLFQEFLAGNAFDTRVTVIGDRAFAFRRMNRVGDFRASGSGAIDYSIDAISMEAVGLALNAADRLRTQSCAFDILRRESELVIGEISYTYLSSAVHQCPGYWDRSLTWHQGAVWPEDVQLADFLGTLSRRAEFLAPPT